jgi:hypothetical protein
MPTTAALVPKIHLPAGAYMLCAEFVTAGNPFWSMLETEDAILESQGVI